MHCNRVLCVLCLVSTVAVGPTTYRVSAQSEEQKLPGVVSEWFGNYESELATVVADERLVQQISSRVRSIPSHSQTLHSTYSFVQLLDDDLWLGIREVKSIDGFRLPAETPTLLELLQAPTLERARELAWRNARRNLGPPRTTNVPTLPLEFLRPRNRERFVYRSGMDMKDGLIHVSFTEVRRPTLLRSPDGKFEFLTYGDFFVEPASGVLRVAKLEAKPIGRDVVEWSLEVRLRNERSIGLVVPYEATERFLLPEGNGEGRATYRNFKRFSTAAKIRP